MGEGIPSLRGKPMVSGFAFKAEERDRLSL